VSRVTCLPIHAETRTKYLSIGVVERAPIGSTLWCTNLLFSPSGLLLSKHRKLQPTAAERIVWSQGEGRNPGAKGNIDGDDNLAVVKTEVGRIGGLICWESMVDPQLMKGGGLMRKTLCHLRGTCCTGRAWRCKWNRIWMRKLIK
jgi:predicted amidohydrolase